MLKKILIVIILLVIDIVLFNYLNNYLSSLKTFEYKYDKDPLIIQKKDIVLAKIDDFNFNDYFEILSFNNDLYNYKFDEDNNLIYVTLSNNKTYSFSYSIMQAEVITKTEYITNNVYIDNSEYSDYVDNNIYYSVDYYEFELGTDLSTIIQIVQDDVVSYTNVTCDYSSLNPYQIGQYDIYLYNDFNKIVKTIKII